MLRPVSLFRLSKGNTILNSRLQNKIRKSGHEPRLSVSCIANTQNIAYLHTNCIKCSQQSDLPELILKDHMRGIQPSKLKISRKPFIKALFNGEFDKDVLAFPEVMNYEELSAMQRIIQTSTNFMSGNVSSEQIDAESKIPPQVIEGLKYLGLFSTTAPSNFGGLDLKTTENVWLLDSLGSESAIAETLNSHQSLVQQLALSMNQQQKEKYLKKLSTGEAIIAFCMTEESAGSDAAMIQTRAIAVDKDSSFTISGQKTWVTNGEIADYLIVLAKMNTQDYAGVKQDLIGAFIVDKNSEGISVSPADEKVGLKGLNTCSINFDKVIVPKENLIGDSSSGHQLYLNLSIRSKLSQSASAIGLMKEMINYTVKHCTDRVQFGKPLMEFATVQEKIAKIVYKTYAAESMVYLTAGLDDSSEIPDIDLEASVTKIFTTEALAYCVGECNQLLGSKSLLKDNPLDRVYRDAKGLLLLNGSNDVLKLVVALTGISLTGKANADSIEKLRNPMFNPKFAFFKIIEHENLKRGKIKLTFDLSGYLHESLHTEAELLEYATKRLTMSVQTSLVRYGQDIVSRQMTLNKLSDIAMLIYAMTASLSRCSRSYCIGLPNSNLEYYISSAFCRATYETIEKLTISLEDGPFITNDALNEKIASEIFKSKGYAPVNPALRNY